MLTFTYLLTYLLTEYRINISIAIFSQYRT